MCWKRVKKIEKKFTYVLDFEVQKCVRYCDLQSSWRLTNFPRYKIAAEFIEKNVMQLLFQNNERGDNSPSPFRN